MSWAGHRVNDDVMAEMWGNGRLRVGLLDYFEFARARDALQAAVRLGDYILSRLPAFHEPRVRARLLRGRRALGFICWTQNVEGLAKLSAISGKPRFLLGAKKIAAHVGTTPGQHSHGLLTSLRGILEINRQDSDEGWLRIVEGIWFEISDSRHFSPTGSVSEFLDPEPRRDEGCSVADWLMLSLDLWHRTGDTVHRVRRANLVPRLRREPVQERGLRTYLLGRAGLRLRRRASMVVPHPALLASHCRGVQLRLPDQRG